MHDLILPIFKTVPDTNGMEAIGSIVLQVFMVRVWNVDQLGPAECVVPYP